MPIVSTSGLNGAPAGTSGPKWASGLYDGLKLPSGKTIVETNNEELRSQFAKIGLLGAHSDGREVLCQRYATLLSQIHDDAGKAAVDKWLQDNRG